ncbi:hypothetical protein ACF0H5_009082 [Mactra antiquata]
MWTVQDSYNMDCVIKDNIKSVFYFIFEVWMTEFYVIRHLKSKQHFKKYCGYNPFKSTKDKKSGKKSKHATARIRIRGNKIEPCKQVSTTKRDKKKRRYSKTRTAASGKNERQNSRTSTATCDNKER